MINILCFRSEVCNLAANVVTTNGKGIVSNICPYRSICGFVLKGEFRGIEIALLAGDGTINERHRTPCISRVCSQACTTSTWNFEGIGISTSAGINLYRDIPLVTTGGNCIVDDIVVTSLHIFDFIHAAVSFSSLAENREGGSQIADREIS